MSSRTITAWLAAGAAAALAITLASPVMHTTPQAVTSPPPVARDVLQRLPLSFERMAGGEAAADSFVAHGLGRRLWLSATGATVQLDGLRGPGQGDASSAGDRGVAQVAMHVVGGDPAAPARALERQPGASHYFAGADPAGWRRDVARYGKVRYAGVYPGIDLVYYGNQRDLEYDFVVAPGADPGPIALAFTGVERMRIDDEGNLRLATAHGELLQHKPVVYQDVDGQRRLVEAGYALRDGMVDFVLGEYDRALALVIDPVISYSTFLGGSYSDVGRAIAVDRDGNFYVAGNTSSIDFPLVSPIQGAAGGDGNDLFVAKYDPNGVPVYSTYLASSQFDQLTGIDVDASGRAYVVGYTDGPDFPVVNGIQSGPVYPGGRAVFVTRFSPEGDAVEFSTYLGGTADYGRAIAVDDNGNAYVTGAASYNFPTTPGVIDPDTEWGDDVFVSKVDTNQGTLVYSTYIDGEDTGSSGYAIAVDVAGNAYVGGIVSGSHFPVVGGSPRLSVFSNNDGFLAKLNPTGTALLYSTYFGGLDHDTIVAIDVDGEGRAYVAGITQSDDLPVASALQPGYGGGSHDAFVARFDTQGGGIDYATYLGGNDGEGYYELGIAAGADGSAYVAGSTYSGDFPVVDAIQPTRVGTRAGFVSRLAPDGGSLLFSTFLGAEQYSYTEIRALALDGDGNVYVTGITDGSEFPMVGAAQAELQDNYQDAFVTRIAIGSGTSTDATPRSDFDGDGRDDIVWRHQSRGSNAIWLGADAATPRAMTAVRNLDWEIVGVGDFGGDGEADVFWRNRANGANVIWRSGDYGSQQATRRITDGDWRVVGTGDLDGDGSDDVVWHNQRTGAGSVWRSGSYALRASLPRVRNLDWRIVGVGDFDGDGLDDILWRNGDTGSGTYWPAGDAGDAQAMTRITNLAWEIVGVGDYDGDGSDDVFWRNAETGANALWPSADYAARKSVIRIRNLGWQVVASGRYDGDARDDLLWRHATTGANVIWKSADYATQQPAARVSDIRWRVVP